MTLFALFEGAKSFAAYVISSVAEHFYQAPHVYLPRAALPSELTTEDVVRRKMSDLSSSQKNQVYGKVYELAKMEDPTVGGHNWGQEHAYDSFPRLSLALDRTGLFHQRRLHLATVRCLSFDFGEGGLGSQYFGLGDRAARNPLPGHVGYVNGMGIPTLEHATNDARGFSDRFVDGNNIHGVYHATHQATPSGDLWGFSKDVLRMKAVDGGSYTKTSYLIAQQWIDFLIAHPTRNYLQAAHSEGAVHVNAALRLIKNERPELLPRIRVMTLCPAYYISPQTYPGAQIVNLVKREDSTVNPWGTGADKIGVADHIKVVPHTGDHPHNPISDDFVRVGKRYVDEFMRSGNIY